MRAGFVPGVLHIVGLSSQDLRPCDEHLYLCLVKVASSSSIKPNPYALPPPLQAPTMDKSGSIAKAIVVAPTLDPVHQVEYGCGELCISIIESLLSYWASEHIEHFMTSSSENAEKLTSSYAHLNSLLGKPVETQTAKDPKDSHKAHLTTLRPTYLCLQCATISALEERDAHCKSKKHMWCMSHRTSLQRLLTFWQLWRVDRDVCGVAFARTMCTIPASNGSGLGRASLLQVRPLLHVSNLG